MKITVNSQVKVEYPSTDLILWCRKNLIVDNPDYIKKVRMNKWVGNTPEKLHLYQKFGETLLLPYGCLKKVVTLMDGTDSIAVEIIPHSYIEYNCDVPLYDYQEEAVAAAIKAQYGILQAPAGSGKTQMGIAMAAKIGKPTLWLTHTHDLLMQSKERAEQYMNASWIGTITEGKVNIGSGITFATVQTMCKLDLRQYKDLWDTVIVDECHRVAGTPTAMTQFSKVLNALEARHKYGLSATVHRADGMIKATYAMLGNIVWTVPEEAVAEKIMTVSILPRPTGIQISSDVLDTDGTIVYARLVNWLCANKERNDIILADLVDNWDHYNLILSDRLSHLTYLIEHLPEELRDYAVMVDGKMTSKKQKDERAKALEDMRAGRKRYLFATYSLAKEGLDIPRLDRLYLTTPQKDYAVVAQSVGRIARAFEGKGEPVVYDYVDNRMQYLLRSYKRRCTTYNKLKCTYLEDNK